MDRRAAIGLVAAWLAGTSRAAQAQAAAPKRVGFLGNGAPGSNASFGALRRGLLDLGWIEGRSVAFETRWAGGDPDRIAPLIAELVNAAVDVIVVAGPAAIGAAQRATTMLPVVFVVLIDPVALGVARSFARPGGNLTGVASQFEEIITKQLQLLKEAVPGLTRVALLRRSESAESILHAAEAAGRELGLAVRTLTVVGTAGFERAFETARAERIGAVHVLPSPYLAAQSAQVIALAERYRLPACYELGSYVRAGGLMAYGPDIDAMFARSASYVDRILKGAFPGELAIERPSRFELVINLRAAAAIGLAIPPSLVQRADQLIR